MMNFLRRQTALLPWHLLMFSFYVMLASVSAPRMKADVKTVVINAGHGGTDPGCHGLKYYEKDVALAIAKKLGDKIQSGVPGVKVVYTRTTDVFVPLNEIAAHANKNDADLFICIHCNASVNKEVYGSETYVMGLHKTKGNLEVAKRENASILYEEDYQKKYEGFDPNSDEANIIFSMYQNVYLEKSLSFAAKVQQEFKKLRRSDKGVKQAGFLVLWKTKMPSVLIETGFLTNPEEEKYLGSAEGQEDIANGIFEAFKQYKAETEGGIPSEPSKTEVEPAVKAEEPGQKLTYTVQVANTNKKIPLTSKRFSGLSNVWEKEEQGHYKYFAGQFETLEEAVDYQQKIKSGDFKDAFIVAFFEGKKITLKEAREQKKNQ
jgi:N-acetylmuramoyl-L-alanine amidase